MKPVKKKLISFRVEESLHRRLRILAATVSRTIESVAEEILREGLDKRLQ